jgi:hypothetical protein
VFEKSTGRLVRKYDSGATREMLHSPRVEGTRDGRLMFVGNADGALCAHDLRCGVSTTPRSSAVLVGCSHADGL